MIRSAIATAVVLIAYAALLACNPSGNRVISGGAGSATAAPTTAAPTTAAPTTAAPSPTAAALASPSPAPSPTAAPTTPPPPTAAPTTAAPTAARTATPTVAPTVAPTPSPTVAPTPSPSPSPTVVVIARPVVPTSGLAIHGRVTNAAGVGVGNACITLGPPIRCWTRTSSGTAADTGYYLINLSDVAATPGSTWDIYVVQTTCAQYYSGKFVVSGVFQHNATLSGGC